MVQGQRSLCKHMVWHRCGTGPNSVICREHVVIARPRECYHTLKVRLHIVSRVF